MKRIFTISIAILTLFFASCARSSYPQPAFEKETTTVHNVNNIFN